MSINNKNFRRAKLGIREEMILSYAILTIVALGSIAVTTGLFINRIGDTTTVQTTEALEMQAQSDMNNKTYNFALIIESQLESVAADVNGLAEAINNVLYNPIEFAPRNSYYHADFLPAGTQLFDGSIIANDEWYFENQPSDIRYDPNYELNISDSYSHYLLYSESYNGMGQDPYNLNNSYGDVINRTAQLDPIFSDIWHSNPIYAWMYVDFEIGIQRTFPWTGVDTTVFGGNGESFHDYKDDEWYIDAANSNGEIVWTAPYIDPYLGWMISISRAVYNGTEVPANFVGVIGLDIRLNAITNTVGDISFLNSGYGFLIDNEGIVISHPDIVFNPEDEEYIEIQDVEPISDTVYNNMMELKSGFTIFSKDQKSYYLSYSPINVSGYSLGIIVPQKEVLATVYVLEDALNAERTTQITILISIIVVVMVIVLLVGYRVATSVVRPIQKLTNLAMQLSTDNVKQAALRIDSNFDEDLQQDDEIGDLTRAFKNLLDSVREDAEDEK